jgi:BirA family transcriptional regulator, biotin operon repressor / biotin---[acetyl-CoA-carboxylase] ligase
MSDDQPDQHVQPAPYPLPFVRAVLRRPVVDSTNDLAKSMLLQGLDELPFLIWADRQILGRGRGRNQWWSDEGSLTFTIALDPTAHGMRIDQEPRLALMTAGAVIKAINVLGLTDPGIGIRWPNDIEVHGRKLGGILPERIETRPGHRSLIGVGLNVLTRIDQAPPEVQRMATSLSALQLQPLDPSFIAGFVAAILTQFERALYRLAADDPGLAHEWDRLNLLRDQVVRVALGPRVISGKVQGIDAQGALGVHDGRQMHRLFGGQVLRDPSGDT